MYYTFVRLCLCNGVAIITRILGLMFGLWCWCHDTDFPPQPETAPGHPECLQSVLLLEGSVPQYKLSGGHSLSIQTVPHQKKIVPFVGVEITGSFYHSFTQKSIET